MRALMSSRHKVRDWCPESSSYTFPGTHPEGGSRYSIISGWIFGEGWVSRSRLRTSSRGDTGRTDTLIPLEVGEKPLSRERRHSTSPSGVSVLVLSV